MREVEDLVSVLRELMVWWEKSPTGKEPYKMTYHQVPEGEERQTAL